MCVYPDHSQFAFWLCHFYTSNSGAGNAMIAADNNREKIILERFRNGLTYFFIHRINTFYSFGIRGFDRFIKQFIFIRNSFRWEMNKEVTHKIHGGHLYSFHTKTGAKGAGPDLRWYF